jgi:hypothetical protein
MTVIDLAAAREARDNALDRVAVGRAEWIEHALAVVGFLAENMREFNADDFWLACDDAELPSPDERRVFGVVMLKARKAGLVESTGRFVACKRPGCHAMPIRVWRSLVFEVKP